MCADQKAFEAATSSLAVDSTVFGIPVAVVPLEKGLVEELQIFLDVDDAHALELMHELHYARAGYPTVATTDVGADAPKVTSLTDAALAVRALEVVAGKGLDVVVDTGLGMVEIDGAPLEEPTDLIAAAVVDDRPWWKRMLGIGKVA